MSERKRPETFAIIVKFERTYLDELPVIEGKFPELKTEREKLIRQFVEELQGAYDHEDTGISGHFQVIGFEDGGAITEEDRRLGEASHAEP